ncbi:MAG: hypothetical protein P8M22_01470 [Phycisphaerales bacterium]|nr:hypothetical protein [Phycisphaerales bacterium]
MRIPHSVVFSILAGVLASSGCTSDKYHTWGYIKNNLTPEMAGISETKLDQERDLAVSNDTDWRAFSDDWGRVWLTDQPTKLSPYPLVNTGGNPN